MDLEVVAKLKEYKGLLDDGIINEDEFNDMKKVLLDKDTKIEKASVVEPAVAQPKPKVHVTTVQSGQQNSGQPQMATNAAKTSVLSEGIKQAKEEGFLTNDNTAQSTAGLSGADRWQAATVDAFRNIFNFKGRLSKEDFWWTVLSLTLITIVATILMIIPALGILLFVIWSIVMTIMGLSMSIRRLHDTGRPWPWYLLSWTGIGSLVLLIWFLEDGQLEANQWGPATK